MKTLKDLDKELETWHDRTSADWVINWTKQEAIKQIKGWKENLSEGVWVKIDKGLIFESDNIKKVSDHNLIGRIDSFIRFFNITEEDFGTPQSRVK